MPVTAMPPPVVVGPGGLPASICEGLPEFTRDNKRYCVLGLRVMGENDALEKATAKLLSEGWSASIVQVSPTSRIIILKADGKSLSAISGLQGRVGGGEFGPLTISVAALSHPGQ
jgi:hypothetical protein